MEFFDVDNGHFSPTGAPVSIMTGRLAADALIKSLEKETKKKKR